MDPATSDLERVMERFCPGIRGQAKVETVFAARRQPGHTRYLHVHPLCSVSLRSTSTHFRPRTTTGLARDVPIGVNPDKCPVFLVKIVYVEDTVAG